MFKNMKIAQKLYYGFGIVILFMVVLLMISINTFKSLNSEVETLIKDKFPKTIWANNIIDLLNENARTIRNAILTNDPAMKEVEINRALVTVPKITANLDSLKWTVKTESDLAIIKKILEKRKLYLQVKNDVIALIQADKKQEATDMLFSQMRPIQNDYMNEINNMIVYQNDLVKLAGRDAGHSMDSATLLLYLIGLGALVFAVIIAWFTARGIVTPLEVAVAAAVRLGKGNMDVNLENVASDETGMLLNAMKNMASNINSLVSEISRVAQAGVEGKLDVRANERQFQGEYKKVIAGFNSTLNSIIAPLNVAAEYVDRIAKGDIPPKITDDYNGDFNEIKNNLNMAIDAVSLLVSDAGTLADAAVQGRLDTRVDADRHHGDFRAIIKGVNNTLDSVIGPLNVAAEYVDRIAKGDIPPKITDNYNGDFNEIKNNLNTAIDAINLLVSDAQTLATSAVLGKLDTRANAEAHQGRFREIVQGVNATLDSVIGPLNVAAEYIDRIGKGDIPPKITDNYNGDFNEIKINLNMAIDAVNLLISDSKTLAKAAVQGRLDTRVDSAKHQGNYREIIEGFNATLDSVIDPLNVAAEYVDRIAKGDIPPKITDNYNGDFNEIKNNLNMAIDAVNLLVADTQTLAKSAVAGKLDTRADALQHQGKFRDIVVGFNATLDSVIDPLNVAAEYVDRIGKGDIPPKITDHYNGDFNEIKNNLNMAIDSINLLVSDTQILAKSAIEGELDTRADAGNLQGRFREIVEGVNATIDSLTAPIKVTSQYLDRIAKGDIPQLITDEYKGDFNEIKNNINGLIDSTNAVSAIAVNISKGMLNNEIKLRGPNDELMNALMIMSAAIHELVADAKMLAGASVAGKLSVRANADKHHGDFRAIIEGVNDTLDSVVHPLNIAANYVDRIAKGDIPDQITDNFNGDFNEIKNNLNMAISAVNALVADTKILSQAAVEGKLSVRADVDKHFGEYREIVEGINATLDSVVNPVSVTANYLDRIGKGDIPEIITGEYKGDFNGIKNSLNMAISAVNALVDDTKLLSKSALEGKLDTRADAGKHHGEYRAIVEGINRTLDLVIEPINEAGEILEIMATGNLTVRMEGKYTGDLAKLQDDVNLLAESLSNLINQVNDSVQKSTCSAMQISSNAESLTHASQKQSSQSEEVASAVEEMSCTIAQNAENAKKTAEVAKHAGENASEGGNVVTQTVNKMRDIALVVKNSADNIGKLGESSKRIGEIISVIDDIADQTNLLALNAAIEAARAGEQGRGFAVVADEVRKLAERTTEATKQISTMIKGIQGETQEAVLAMNKGNDEVRSGIELADKAGSSLQQILSGSEEVLQMINQIAVASEQQSSTSDQISKNVMSISGVIAESAEKVKHVAHTADELAKLTESLSELMQNFKVSDNSKSASSKLQLNGYKRNNRMLQNTI